MQHVSFVICLTMAAHALAQQGTGVESAGRAATLSFPVYGLTAPVTSAGGAALSVAGKTQTVQVQETSTGMKIDLAADVLFDFNKATIRPNAQEALSQVATLIRDNAKGVVRIEGHTDSKGTPARNQTLSMQRAQAVKDWLQTRHNLSSVRFQTQGFGPARPVAPNTKPNGSDDPDGRQKNRRVEIFIEKS